ALALALLPLALWLLQRYFEAPRLMIGRGVLLGFSMAALFYTTLTVVAAFAILGLWTLWIYPRRLLRWLLPALVALISAAPEIVNKASLGVRRTAATAELALPPLPEAIARLFADYAGSAAALWAILGLIALVLLLLHRRHQARVLLL